MDCAPHSPCRRGRTAEPEPTTGHVTMRRTLITGGLLAVFAALLAQFGGALGLDEIRSALLGAAIGATLGLVPTVDSPTSRAVGFVVGFVLGWAGYAIRAGVLPDTGA